MANTNQKLRMLLEAERAKSAALQATLEKQANDYALLQKKLRYKKDEEPVRHINNKFRDSSLSIAQQRDILDIVIKKKSDGILYDDYYEITDGQVYNVKRRLLAFISQK